MNEPADRLRSAKPKNGTSRASAADRKIRFADAYVAHGENGTRAAMAIGVPEPGAAVQASRWLKDVKVRKLIEKRRAELRLKYALTTDRVVQELARVSYFNPKNLVDVQGRPIPLHKLPDDTAAALAMVEITETSVRGRGRDRVVTTKKTKGRPFNKPTALEKSIKILRLYDKPPPLPPDEEGHITEDPKELARRMAFVLARGAAAIEEREAPKAPSKRKKLTLAA